MLIPTIYKTVADKRFLFTLLFALYFLLLLFRNGSIGLFVGDEITYTHSVYSLLSGKIDTNNHPLFAKSIWAVIVLLSESLLNLDSPLFWRLGTMIFSLGTLCVFYKLCRMFFNSTRAVLCTFFMAFDPMYFVFSRLMQLDIIALFFSLSCFYFLLRFFKEKSNKLLMLSGLMLGFSLATKLTALVLLGIIPLSLIVSMRKHFDTKGFLKMLLMLFFSIFCGYVAGNGALFVLRVPGVNIINYTADLLNSQLNMPKNVIGYLNSTPLSWFTVPQIMTIYRLDFRNYVETVEIFQNPVFFASGIAVVVVSILTYNKMKPIRRKGIALTLFFLLGQYIPWFMNVHMTYYYYILPLIPLIIILFMNLVDGFKSSGRILLLTVLLTCGIFMVYFPLLTGIKVSKSYELLLYNYSRYPYTQRDSLFCQNCSPRI